MNLVIPGLSDMLTATKDMPQQFDTLIARLDTVISLLEEQNKLIVKYGG